MYTVCVPKKCIFKLIVLRRRFSDGTVIDTTWNNALKWNSSAGSRPLDEVFKQSVKIRLQFVRHAYCLKSREPSETHSAVPGGRFSACVSSDICLAFLQIVDICRYQSQGNRRSFVSPKGCRTILFVRRRKKKRSSGISNAPLWGRDDIYEQSRGTPNGKSVMSWR